MRGIKKLFIIAAVLIVLIVVNMFLEANYVVFRPGTAENLKEIITVENGVDNSEEGSFFLVTVAQQPANLLLFIGSLAAPSIELFPLWRIHPPGIDIEEYYEIERRRMRDSQHVAKIIALRRIGYHVPIISDGVLVVELIEGSPAENVLEPGDVITELDGETINLSEELVEKIMEKPVGSEVLVTFERDQKVMTRAISTVSHTEDKEKSGLRIYIRTLDWEPDLPVDIDIGTGAIAGPSAGLMFVLEIINQLELEDISHGKKIVGTGTINIQEEVGPIGGIKQKISAAEAVGAEYFLVPAENIQEAKTVARKIELIEVKTLQDALNFLENIPADLSLYFEQSSLSKVYEGEPLWEVL